MVTDKAKCVRFDFSKGALKIFSSSPELGDASEEIPVKYEGQALVLMRVICLILQLRYQKARH